MKKCLNNSSLVRADEKCDNYATHGDFCYSHRERAVASLYSTLRYGVKWQRSRLGRVLLRLARMLPSRYARRGTCGYPMCVGVVVEEGYCKAHRWHMTLEWQ